MTRRISPLGLPIDTTQGSFGVDVELVGAQCNAASGFITATGTNPAIFAQLGPLGLAGPVRQAVQQTGINIEVVLTGAEARCQGQELLGANATITLDAGVSANWASIDAPSEGRDDLVNPNAEIRDHSGNTICEMSGQKLYPGEAVENWMGRQVRPRSVDADPFREELQYRSTERSDNPLIESSDTFISDSVGPEDL